MTKPDPAALVAASARALAKLHVGLQLDAMATDAERAAQCRKWHEEARNKFFQGQAEVIADLLLSREERYQHMDVRARTIAAQTRWAGMAIAKDLIGEEQMFGRWAMMYSLAVLESR